MEENIVSYINFQATELKRVEYVPPKKDLSFIYNEQCVVRTGLFNLKKQTIPSGIYTHTNRFNPLNEDMLRETYMIQKDSTPYHVYSKPNISLHFEDEIHYVEFDSEQEAFQWEKELSIHWRKALASNDIISIKHGDIQPKD